MNALFRYADAMARHIPEPCVLCASPTHNTGLCPECRADLPGLSRTRCPTCAGESPTGETCGRCLRHRPHFDHVCAPVLYRYPVDRLVQRLKFGRTLNIARILGLELARAVRHEPTPDLIVAAPLSNERMRERGFNQSLEIARHLSTALDLPLARDALERVHHTPAQMGLSLADRRRNVRGVFLGSRRLDGLRVALVDDVMTSGATLDEMALTLKKAGAQWVTGWIAARTPEASAHFEPF